MEEVDPRRKLGTTIRNRRNVLGRSLNETTAEVAKRLGSDSFTNVVLGEIERGVRPATMDELVAIAGALDIELDTLKQCAIEWHESVWDGKPRYELHPGDTDAATIHGMSLVEAMDELRGVMADMQRGKDVLHRAGKLLDKQYGEREVALDCGLTAALLGSSINRIEVRLNPERAKAAFALDDEEG